MSVGSGSNDYRDAQIGSHPSHFLRASTQKSSHGDESDRVQSCIELCAPVTIPRAPKNSSESWLALYADSTTNSESSTILRVVQLSLEPLCWWTSGGNRHGSDLSAPSIPVHRHHDWRASPTMSRAIDTVLDHLQHHVQQIGTMPPAATHSGPLAAGNTRLEDYC